MSSETGRFSRCHLGTYLCGYSVEAVYSQRLVTCGLRCYHLGRRLSEVLYVCQEECCFPDLLFEILTKLVPVLWWLKLESLAAPTTSCRTQSGGPKGQLLYLSLLLLYLHRSCKVMKSRLLTALLNFWLPLQHFSAWWDASVAVRVSWQEALICNGQFCSCSQRLHMTLTAPASWAALKQKSPTLPCCKQKPSAMAALHITSHFFNLDSSQEHCSSKCLRTTWPTLLLFGDWWPRGL